MEKPHIVLVEDDDVLAEFLMDRLKIQQMEPVRFANGADAVSGILVGNKIDLILLDISLPDIDGFEVLKRIASFQASAHIPVIIASNYSQEQDIEWGKKMGVMQFINKASATPVEIVDAVIDTLAKGKAPQVGVPAQAV
jgi:DNA-binding response OmpR family regulator